MDHHEITSMGTSIALVVINLLTLNTREVAGVTSIEAQCSLGFTSDGLSLANCSADYNKIIRAHGIDKIFDVNIIIPKNLPTTIKVLDISQNGGKVFTPILLNDQTTLNNYPKLQRIIIKHSVQVRAPDSPQVENNKRVLANVFKDLNSLECLEFSSSSLNDKFPITFPKNLKTLIIRNNTYTYLSVQWCEQLVELDANLNGLIMMPKLHVPNPPLTTLRMRGSPLMNMTILDIASLCNLTLLELEFPPKSHYLTEAGYCQCVMLKNWAKEFDIKGVENVQCATSNQNCPENVFQEARTLHDKCPNVKKNTASTSTELDKSSRILKYALFIFLTLLSASLILFLARYLYSKAGLDDRSSIVMEEGEDDDDERGSSSEIEISKSERKLNPIPKALPK